MVDRCILDIGLGLHHSSTGMFQVRVADTGAESWWSNSYLACCGFVHGVRLAARGWIRRSLAT